MASAFIVAGETTPGQPASSASISPATVEGEFRPFLHDDAGKFIIDSPVARLMERAQPMHTSFLRIRAHALCVRPHKKGLIISPSSPMASTVQTFGLSASLLLGTTYYADAAFRIEASCARTHRLQPRSQTERAPFSGMFAKSIGRLDIRSYRLRRPRIAAPQAMLTARQPPPNLRIEVRTHAAGLSDRI